MTLLFRSKRPLIVLFLTLRFRQLPKLSSSIPLQNTRKLENNTLIETEHPKKQKQKT